MLSEFFVLRTERRSFEVYADNDGDKMFVTFDVETIEGEKRVLCSDLTPDEARQLRGALDDAIRAIEAHQAPAVVA